MPQVKGILSERGDIKVDDRTNTLIVKDIARKIVRRKEIGENLGYKNTPDLD